MKKKYGKEFAIGLSVICALVILVFGIDYLKGINMLSPSNYYYVYFSNVNGLEVSAPVLTDGFKVGQVREISYDYDKPGNIKVMIAVNKQLRIPEDSHAVLSSTLMGSGYIDITMGQGKKMLAVGGDIPTRENPGLMEAVNKEIMPTVSEILPKVDSLVYNLNLLVSDPALKVSLQRLDGITADLLATTGGLRGTLGHDFPVVMGNARNITVKIDTVSTNLVALSRELNRLPLNSSMENLQEITAELSRFSKQLNDGNSTLGKLTTDPELYNRLNRVAADVDSLIVDIKKNPKRYISIKLL